MKCYQCGHDTLMQQEENGTLYLCGYCGYKDHRCPECGGVVSPLLLSVDECTNRPGLFCVKCGYEDTPEIVENPDEGP